MWLHARMNSACVTGHCRPYSCPPRFLSSGKTLMFSRRALEYNVPRQFDCTPTSKEAMFSLRLIPSGGIRRWFSKRWLVVFLGFLGQGVVVALVSLSLSQPGTPALTLAPLASQVG